MKNVLLSTAVIACLFLVLTGCDNLGRKKSDSPVIATININTTNKEGIWSTFKAPVNNITGVHDVYFIFRGEKDLFYFDWWRIR